MTLKIRKKTLTHESASKNDWFTCLVKKKNESL